MTRVAIVTGASRGIGAAIAKRLAKDGISVVVNYASNPADAENVVREIMAAGGKAYAVLADIADPVAVEALFDQTEMAFGGIDILVNNAGVIQPGMVALKDTDDELYQRIFSSTPRARSTPCALPPRACVRVAASSTSQPA